MSDHEDHSGPHDGTMSQQARQYRQNTIRSNMPDHEDHSGPHDETMSQQAQEHKGRQRDIQTVKQTDRQTDRPKKRNSKRKFLVEYQLLDRRDQMERMDKNLLRAIENHHKDSMDRMERMYKKEDLMSMYRDSDS